MSELASPPSIRSSATGGSPLAILQDPLAVPQFQPAPGDRLWRWGVIGAVFFLYLLNAGSFGLWDPWETHYGEVTRYMVETWDWVNPWWGYKTKIGSEGIAGEWFYSKPVYIFWAEATFIKLIGLTDWAFRLPQAILGASAATAVYLGVERIVSRRAAVISTAVVALSPFFYMVSRQAQTDMPFVATLTIGILLLLTAVLGRRQAFTARGFAWVTAGFVLFLLGNLLPQFSIISTDLFDASAQDLATTIQQNGIWHVALFYGPVTLALVASVLVPVLRQRKLPGGLGDAAFQDRWWRRYLLLSSYMLFAQSTYAKGLLGFLLPGAILVLYLAVSRQWKLFGVLDLGRGVPLFFVTVMPWYVAMFCRHGMPYYQRFFIHDHFNRVGAGVHQIDTGTFEYFVEWLGYGLWPWSAFAPLALIALVAAVRAERQPALAGAGGASAVDPAVSAESALAAADGSAQQTETETETDAALAADAVPDVDADAAAATGATVATADGVSAPRDTGADPASVMGRTEPSAVAPPTAAPPQIDAAVWERHTFAQIRVFAFLWFLLAFILFTLSSTRFHHYILPGVPPLAMIVGWYLMELLRDRRPQARAQVILALALLLVATIGVMSDYQNLRSLFTYKYDRPMPEAMPTDWDTQPVWPSDTAPLLGWADQPFGRMVGPMVANLLGLSWFRFELFWKIAGGLAGLSLVLMVGARMRRIGLVLLTATAALTAFWTLNYYMPSLAPHWSQKYLFEKYYEDCHIHPNPPLIQEAFTPLLSRAGLSFIPEYLEAKPKRVCKEDIISWLITWRGETYYSNNEIRPLNKANQLGPYLKDMNRGKTFYVLSERGRIQSFESKLKGESKKLRDEGASGFSAIKDWNCDNLSNDSAYFVVGKCLPVLDDGTGAPTAGRPPAPTRPRSPRAMLPLPERGSSPNPSF